MQIESTTLSQTVAVVHERRRISRDLHDGTIQPYIGLKLGLEALRRRVNGADGLAREVDELIHMAGEAIAELRRYVDKLKQQAHRRALQSVVEGVRCEALKFSEFYGLRVAVSAECDVIVSGPLFEEVMHVVREGLANIRRHTDARRAGVGLRVARGALVLEIDNERGAAPAPTFHPRSIDERARELGGRVHVAALPCGLTRVSVRFPL